MMVGTRLTQPRSLKRSLSAEPLAESSPLPWQPSAVLGGGVSKGYREAQWITKNEGVHKDNAWRVSGVPFGS